MGGATSRNKKHGASVWYPRALLGAGKVFKSKNGAGIAEVEGQKKETSRV